MMPIQKHAAGLVSDVIYERRNGKMRAVGVQTRRNGTSLSRIRGLCIVWDFDLPKSEPCCPAVCVNKQGEVYAVRIY